MIFNLSFRPILLVWSLLLGLIAAQGGCRGDTSIYTLNGLVVPFKNLCGKDIQKKVDFLDPTDERTWSDCLDRCVTKSPLCYGFDFTPYGTTDYSCWLMNATFLESDATTQTYTVDAAMLSPEFLAGLSSDCKTLGLQGCFKKNGQLGTSSLAVQPTSGANPTSTQPSLFRPATISIATTAVTTNIDGEVSTAVVTMVTIVSTATTAATTSTPPSDASGLPAGAKAGIGAGVGTIALVIILVVIPCMLRRRKRRRTKDMSPAHAGENDEIIGSDPHRRGITELQTQQYGPYASPELPGSVPSDKLPAFAGQEQVHEIDGSQRYEK